MGKITKGMFWGLIIVGIVWIGIGVVDSCQSCSLAKPPEKAIYRVEIAANRNILYTSDYTTTGSVYILHGYWEQIKNRYRYRDVDLPLDVETFGNIKIILRGNNAKTDTN